MNAMLIDDCGIAQRLVCNRVYESDEATYLVLRCARHCSPTYQQNRGPSVLAICTSARSCIEISSAKMRCWIGT
jgi:hypothetical protein